MKTKSAKPKRKKLKPVVELHQSNSASHKTNGVHKSNGSSHKTNGAHKTNGNGSVHKSKVASNKASGSPNKTNGTETKFNFKELEKSEHLLTERETPPITDIELLRTLVKVKNGNFSVRLPEGQVGIKKAICDTLNDIIDINERMVYEFDKVGNNIGKKGKLNNRVQLDGARGSWNSCVDSVNMLISDLVHPTIEIAHVITSVAKGNL